MRKSRQKINKIILGRFFLFLCISNRFVPHGFIGPFFFKGHISISKYATKKKLMDTKLKLIKELQVTSTVPKCLQGYKLQIRRGYPHIT